MNGMCKHKCASKVKKEKKKVPEFKHNFEDHSLIIIHLNQTYKSLYVAGNMKLMRVKPQHCLPLSQKQMYIKKNYGKLCQEDFSCDKVCKDSKCPCRDFETLNKDELRLSNSSVLKNRRSFNEYLLAGYREAYYPIHKLNGLMAEGNNLVFMVQLIADKIDSPVCEEECGYKCLMALHTIVPYLPMCRESQIQTIIRLGHQSDNLTGDSSPKSCLDYMITPMLKYWMLDEKYGPKLATICGELMYYEFGGENALNFSLPKFLESTLYYVLEYICPLGHTMPGAETQLEFLLMYHCLLLKVSDDAILNAIIIRNIKKVKATECMLYVEEAFQSGRVDRDYLKGGLFEFLEYTGAPVKADSKALNMERPGCCERLLPAEIVYKQDEFDAKVQRIILREQRNPNWDKKREQWAKSILNFDKKLKMLTKLILRDVDDLQDLGSPMIPKTSMSDEDVHSCKIKSEKACKIKIEKRFFKYIPSFSKLTTEKLSKAGDKQWHKGIPESIPEYVKDVEQIHKHKEYNDESTKPKINVPSPVLLSTTSPMALKGTQFGRCKCGNIMPTHKEDGKNMDEFAKKHGVGFIMTRIDDNGKLVSTVGGNLAPNSDLYTSHEKEKDSLREFIDACGITDSAKTDKKDSCCKEVTSGVKETYRIPDGWSNPSGKTGKGGRPCTLEATFTITRGSNNKPVITPLPTPVAKTPVTSAKTRTEPEKKVLEEENSTSQPQKKIRHCGYCSKIEQNGEKFRKCGGCRKIAYCSQLCQKTHWKVGHKQTCEKDE